MIQKYFQTKTLRNFSIAMLWINGGSNSDCEGKKGINKILSSLLVRGCKGFNNFEFSEYIDSYGAELNLETFEDGILISLKSINDPFYKLLPLLDLIINKPLLLNSQFEIVKKNIFEALKDYKNRIQVTLVPNITNICYGRGVGYKIEEIVLDEKTQQISATKIREQMRKEGKLK